MTERDFLESYDPHAFTPLAVAADAVIITYHERSLHVLLTKRREQPARGRLALPGVFVREDEDLDAAAERALLQKGGLTAPVRQFRSFGDVDRDPRMRIVSVGYMAVLPFAAVSAVRNDDRQLLRVDGDRLRGENGRAQSLPFDHHRIVATALEDLRANLDHTFWAFGLLRAEFTLRELQEVHEAIRRKPLNKPAFRKRLIDSGKIVGTGRMETGTRFRPAELYRINEEWNDEGR